MALSAKTHFGMYHEYMNIEPPRSNYGNIENPGLSVSDTEDIPGVMNPDGQAVQRSLAELVSNIKISESNPVIAEAAQDKVVVSLVNLKNT